MTLAATVMRAMGPHAYCHPHSHEQQINVTTSKSLPCTTLYRRTHRICSPLHQTMELEVISKITEHNFVAMASMLNPKMSKNKESPSKAC